MRSRTTAVIGAVLLAATLAGCSSGGGDHTKETPVNPGVTQPPGTAASAPAGVLGRPVVLSGGLEVTTDAELLPVFTGVLASTPNGQVNAASLSGGALPARVRISVTNRGDAPFDLSHVFVREVVGTTSGGVAAYTDWASVKEKKLAGLVAPGATGEGTVSYSVPPTVASGFRITIAVLDGAGTPSDVVVNGSLPAPPV
ncbi:hypothetical protein [Embleya sp. NPDC005971]|uniref:hypothetical protein n=1 Tax=Embleya sp. NPDC005971 TaxID=3156724 RepID=UPI0034084F8B